MFVCLLNAWMDLVVPRIFRKKARGHGIWLSVVHGAYTSAPSEGMYLVSVTPPTILCLSF